MTIQEAFYRNVTVGFINRTATCELYYNIFSEILPAYALRAGLFYVQDIEDLEAGTIVDTVIEYPSIHVQSSIQRSYVDFVNTAFVFGDNSSFTYNKAQTNIHLNYAHGILKDGNTVLFALGCYSKSIPQEVKDFLYSEESMEPSLEVLQHFTIFMDEKLLLNPEYKTLYKNIRDIVLTQVDSYTVVKNLTEKVFTKIPLEPAYKRPIERVNFLKQLPSLLIAVEQEEVQTPEVIAAIPEIKTKKVVEVQPEADAGWVPPGFS